MTENEKAKAYDEALENQEVHLALHNCGYRFLGKKQEVYIYGKPIGYGILRANIYQDKIEILLILKGNIKDGKQPNLVWNKCSYDISSLDNIYLNCIQIIKDSEAEIFINSPIAIEENAFIRYDFKENNTLDVY